MNLTTLIEIVVLGPAVAGFALMAVLEFRKSVCAQSSDSGHGRKLG